ncbi:MAG: xanthine dehydrogenase family protein subunit M [Variibacter sp.]|nr:xanthine dehydrogenase family protein subunit M [Variibacter sp.]
MSFQVHHPVSLAEALALAARFGDAACFLAGGTDLIIQINRGRQAPAHLINLNALGELGGIVESTGGFTIGALTAHKAVERHPAFQGSLLALAEAARVVGGHQVRNIGTVGGNIVNASPAADVVTALLALDAEVTLQGEEGVRGLKLSEFLLGPGRTARREDEVLVGVNVAKPAPRSGSAFLKAGRRKAMEISVVCVAASVTLDDAGACAGARIALGAVDKTAIRAPAAEASLQGQPLSEANLRAAGQLAAAACQPIDDVRASARYRRLLVEALVPRALRLCVDRIEVGVA